MIEKIIALENIAATYTVSYNEVLKTYVHAGSKVYARKPSMGFDNAHSKALEIVERYYRIKTIK